MTRFQSNIINWYKTNKRDLPWRETNDPYKIWLSEIILQQTRVAQGTDYYLKFVQNYPHIKLLADASEDEILKLWQGLGYYSRARNLHHAAKEVCVKYDGKFPTDFKDVKQLKGIGNYTASAICSFAYHQHYAVVDGNVFRVLSRVFGIDTPIDSPKGKKVFEELADSLLPQQYSSEYNQAIMEFGALQCVPANPDCLNCPLSGICVAFCRNLVKELPVKDKTTKVTERFFNYLFIENNGKFYLAKRTGNDIWKNLYELPLIESDRLFSVEELIENESFQHIFNQESDIRISNGVFDFKHILTHRRINARFFSVQTNSVNMNKNFQEVLKEELEDYAVSRLTEMFFEKALI
jgi:A/G-specific adenine glycosylase